MFHANSNSSNSYFNFSNLGNSVGSFVDPSLLLSGASPASSVFPSTEENSWGMSPHSGQTSTENGDKTRPSSPGTVSPSLFPDASKMKSVSDLNPKMSFSGGPSRSNTTKSARKNSTGPVGAHHHRSNSLSSAQPTGGSAGASAPGPSQGSGGGNDGQLVCSNCSTTVRLSLIDPSHGIADPRAEYPSMAPR